MDAGPAHLIPSAGASRLQPAAAGPGSLQATPAGTRMTSPLAATAAATAAADIHYRVQALDVDAHLFSVQLHIARPAAGQPLSLPVWIPGSYLVREFSKNLQGLSAEQDGGSWRIPAPDSCR